MFNNKSFDNRINTRTRDVHNLRRKSTFLFILLPTFQIQRNIYFLIRQNLYMSWFYVSCFIFRVMGDTQLCHALTCHDFTFLYLSLSPPLSLFLYLADPWTFSSCLSKNNKIVSSRINKKKCSGICQINDK